MFRIQFHSLGLLRRIIESRKEPRRYTNLHALFSPDQEEERKWRTSDLKSRIRKFGPTKLRKKLETLKAPVLMDADTSSQLFERATYVTPETKPNFHTDDGHPCLESQLACPLFFGAHTSASADFG